MNRAASPGPARARGGALEPRQQRSLRRQQQIAEAAVAVIGRDGTARLTHRGVAREAEVSLAATTYYYETRHDIIADASARLLDNYIAGTDRLRRRLAQEPGADLANVAARVLAAGLGRQRLPTLAWCEIMLDCARHSEGHDLARGWYESITRIWLDVARIVGAPGPEAAAVSAVDTLIGLYFTALPLGLDCAGAMAMLRGESAPVPEPAPPDCPVPRTRHGDDTRRRILDAAIAILVEEGPGALTLRGAADRAGVAAAAPSYHFATIGHLLSAAQASLFEGAKDRYRQAMGHFGRTGASLDHLADLTAAVFLREATEFRGLALAGHPARLEAARRPDLRPLMRSAVDDQTRAWNRRLEAIGMAPAPGCGLLLQCLFLGKLVRILATGVSTASLAQVRPDFAHDLAALAAGKHWAKKWYALLD